MSGGNAIGTGAIVLTANADQALAGFDKVTKGASKLVASIDSKVGGKGNSPGQSTLNRMLFGTAEFDAQSGQYLGRVGGFASKIKGAFAGIFGKGGDSATGGILGALTSGNSPLSKLLGGGLGALIGGPVGGLLGGGLSQLLNPQSIISAITGPVDTIMSTLHSISSAAENLAPKAESADQLNSLYSIGSAVHRVDSAVDQLSIKFLSALAPAVNAATNVILAVMDQWSGTIDKVAAGFGAVLYAGTEMGAAILGQIQGLIDVTGDWSGSTSQAESAVFDACHQVADAFAVVWDNIASGASAAVSAFSGMVTGLNVIITAVGGVKKAFADAFGGGKTGTAILGGALGAGAGALTAGPWGAAIGGGAGLYAGYKAGGIDFDKTTNDLAAMSNRLDAIAGRLGNAGTGASKLVDGVFSGIGQRFQSMKDTIQSAGNMIPTKLTGAFSNESKDAYSIVAQYQAQGKTNESLLQQQIKAIQNGNDLLKSIDGKVGNTPTPVMLGSF
jgi:hypothetical protein